MAVHVGSGRVESTRGNLMRQKTDGKWYFSDELGVEEYGPYDSELEARAALDKYAALLSESPEEKSSDSFPAQTVTGTV